MFSITKQDVKDILKDDNFIMKCLFFYIYPNELLLWVHQEDRSFELLIHAATLALIKYLDLNRKNAYDKLSNEISSVLSDYSIQQNLYDAIIKQFVQQGFDLNKINQVGRAPLHFAVCDFNLALISALLETGANVNIQATSETTKGYTPLHFAVNVYNNRNHEVFDTLLKHGIDLSIVDAKGKTALDLARERKHINPKLIAKLEEASEKAQKSSSATLFFNPATNNDPVSSTPI